MKSGAVFERKNLGVAFKAPAGFGKRGKIRFRSSKSRRRCAMRAANSCDWRGFLTLTYGRVFPRNGREVKDHLQDFLDRWRRRKLGPFLWWLEFQARGAPHIHAVTVAVPDRKNPWMVRNWWREITDDPTITGADWELIRNVVASGAYAVKESYKTVQTRVPEGFEDVGRFWGSTRDCREVILSEHLVPHDVNLPLATTRGGQPYHLQFNAGPVLHALLAQYGFPSE